MFFVLLMMRQPPWFTRTGNLFPYQTLIQSNDTLSGGSGRDTFRWGSETSAGEADIIADFESGAGGDVLDVSGLLPGVAPGAGGNELDAYLNVAFDGTNTTIGIDARSEEHTSELPSLMRNSYAVFCLKKKTPTSTNT